MIVHYLAFSLVSFLSFISVYRLQTVAAKRAEINLSVIVCLFLFFVIGFRLNSVDYDNYREIFDSILYSDFGFPFYSGVYGTSGREYLFASSVVGFKFLGLGFEAFVAFVAFVSIYLKFLIFRKHSPYIMFSFLIYLSFLYFKDLGQMRSALAATVIVFAFRYIGSRQYLKYFALISMASGIQVFAILAIFLYPFHWLLGRISKIVILLSSLFLTNFFYFVFYYFSGLLGGVDSILVSKVFGYLYQDRDVNIFGFGNVFRVLVVVTLIGVSSKLAYSRSDIFSVSISSVCFGLVLFNGFSFIPAISERSVDVFVFLPACLLFPLLLNAINDFLARSIIFYSVLSYCLVFFVSGVMSAGEYDSLIFRTLGLT